MSEREQRVREIAHRLWEEEGRPGDQDKRHWATAERMFDADRANGAERPHAETRTAAPVGTDKRATRKTAKRTPARPQPSATH